MEKRKFTMPLCLVLTVAVALFGGAEVMAYEGSLVVPVDDCTMEALDGTPQLITVQVQRPDNHTWQYHFSGIGSGANQVTTLVPVCLPELNYGNSIPTPNILTPGLGDPTSGFGFGDFQNYVLRASAVLNGSQGTVTVTTGMDTGNRATSLQLKAGKSFYYCKNISGPSCADSSISSRLHSTCENILTGIDETGLTTALADPFSIKTVINETSCEITVSVWDGLDCQGTSTPVEAGTMALNFGGSGEFTALDCGSSNQRCGICELVGRRNPCSITKYAAGRPYTYCYNCTTGAQVLPCP